MDFSSKTFLTGLSIGLMSIAYSGADKFQHPSDFVINDPLRESQELQRPDVIIYDRPVHLVNPIYFPSKSIEDSLIIV